MLPNLSTGVRNAQNALAATQPRQGFITLVDWAEYRQAIVQATNSAQAHRQWLAAHRLVNVNPSEIFAS